MTPDQRQFLLTAAWLFIRHGRRDRALALCEALVEDSPRDGPSAAALASLLLDAGDPARALDTLRAADFPSSLAHASAVLETRALRDLGRNADAASRWRRYLASRRPSRAWVSPPPSPS